jgi:Right handed beta helix region
MARPRSGGHPRSRLATWCGAGLMAVLAGGSVWVVLAAADASGTAGLPRPLIRSGPLKRTTAVSALFRFVDARHGIRFECSLDRAAFVGCKSPVRYGMIDEMVERCVRYRKRRTAAGGRWGRSCKRVLERQGKPLSAGAHVFRVWAKSPTGARSRIAAYRWTIEGPRTSDTNAQSATPQDSTPYAASVNAPEKQIPQRVYEAKALPQISGIAEEGETLSASTGTWIGSPTSYSYQWKEYVEATESFEPIEGATSSVYALGGLDSGHRIAVEVCAENANGESWPCGVSQPTGPVTELPTANEWVSESGGSCTRYSSRRPYQPSGACGSLNAAIAAAHCGDVVEVEEGAYADHEWEAGAGKGPGSRAEEHIARENSNLDSCSTQVVVEPASGGAVHINRLQVGGGRNGGQSPDWVAFKGLSIYEATNLMEKGEHVTVEEQQGAIFDVEGDKHVVIENSHFGPCETHEGTPGGEGTAEHPCIGDNHILGYDSTPTEYVAVKHNVIERFTIYEGHFECLFLGGGKHLLIEGNRFHTCQLMGIFIQPRGTEAGQLEDVEIQDNWISQIESASHPGPTEQRGTAISVGANNGSPVNFLIRYNSLGEHESIQTESGSIGGYFDVIGNLFDGTDTCQAGYTYAYNGWFGAHRCSSGEAEDLAVPYLDASLATPNFALTSGSTPAKGLVPDSEPKDKIEWDYSGDRRSPAGPWDAGSDE